MARPITKYLDDDGNEHNDLSDAQIADQYIAARNVTTRYINTLDQLPQQQLTMKANTLHAFINWLVVNDYVITKSAADPHVTLSNDFEDKQPDTSLFDGATGKTTMDTFVGVHDVA